MRLTDFAHWIIFWSVVSTGQRFTLFPLPCPYLFPSPLSISQNPPGVLPAENHAENTTMPMYDFESPTEQPRPRSLSRKPVLLVLLVLLVTLGAVWSNRTPEADHQPALTADANPTGEVEAVAPALPDTLPAEPEPRFIEISGRIQRGEVFSEALKRENIPQAQIVELVSAVRAGVHRAEFNPHIVQRGDRYAIETDSLGVIHRFEYIKKGAVDTRFVAKREAGVLKAWKERIPLNRQVVIISGQIEDMLWNALIATGESPAVLSDKMTDIFEYYIDFMVDCRKGDRFSLAVEKFDKDGTFVRYGDILSTEYRAARKSYQAFLYETPDGDVAYYDAEGKSLRGLFLKSPLNYRRISSRYSRRRFHPILKKFIPHHGVDYAAGYGAPVWATAGGTVTFIGRKGALGNYVEIRHKNGYKTGYGHLSRFRKSLKKGSHVKQKQTIGYVGATGRATGPHLHYNFYALAKGKYRPINPAKVVNRPTGNPVPKPDLSRFLHHRDRLWTLLDRTTGSVVTAALTPQSEAGVPGGKTSPAAAGPTQ